MNRLGHSFWKVPLCLPLFVAILLWTFQPLIHAQGANKVATVSAGSYEAVAIAPESIVSSFGPSLATSVEIANSIPLPTLLAGTMVRIKDSKGVDRLAPLFFVSPTQINHLIPANTASGEATITVTNSEGTISTGKVQIAQVAPSIFTANANGKGVAAAVAFHTKGSRYVPVMRPDRSKECFVHEPIDLNDNDDKVFLILYSTGIRNAADLNGDGNLNETIQAVIGGIKITPSYAGALEGFAGLDQINVELPRTLIGRGIVECTLTVNGFATSSNRTTIEITPPENELNAPIVTNFSPSTILAGKILTISGLNFDPMKDKNLLLCGCTETREMETATVTRLSAKIPFGTASGLIAVRTSRGQGESKVALNITTSISGYIENTAEPPVPLAGVMVRVPGYSDTALTDKEGIFVLALPIAQANSGLVVEIVPPPQLQYPSTPIKMPVVPNRDNHRGHIPLQQGKLTGQNALPFGLADPPATSAPPTQPSHSNSGLSPFQSVRVIQDNGIKFEIADNAAAIFSGGGTNGTIFLNLIEQSRTPVELPPGVFSSAIAQLTPYRVKLTPGGKLIFPNRDRLPPNSQPRLYRYDQTPNSPTFGTFVEAGPATVSASGEFIETLPTAITETSIFLAAVPLRVTTVIGRVVESDRTTPVRGTVVRANGQEAITDGNGGFVLRNVSVPDNAKFLVEASVQRPSGRVDRTQSLPTVAVLNGVTSIENLVFSPLPPNRPPVFVAPSSLEVTEGLVLQATVLANDPDSDRPLQVRLDGPGFSQLDSNIANANSYTLRAAPPAGSAQIYRLTITGTDVDGASTSQIVQLTVKANRPPTLAAPAVRFAIPGQLLSFIISATDLDNTQPGIVTLQAFTFSEINLPPGATLTRLADGMSARFDWTPAISTTGSFTPSFSVTDNGTPPLGSDSRSTMIKVGLPWAQTGNIEAAQTFALLPVGSNLLAGTTGGVFLSTNQGQSWISRNNGLTTLHVNTLVSSGPILLAGTNGGGIFRSSNNAQDWTSCGGLPNGVVRALAVNGQVIFAGTLGSGVFRSTDGCQGWTQINNGLGNLEANLKINALLVSGSILYAGTEGGGIFSSGDNGQNWQPVNTGLVNLKIRALTVSSTTLMAGTDGNGIYCSNNGGQNWGLCSSGLINPRTTINALVANGGDVFACTSGDGVFRSANQGGIWVSLGKENEGLKNPFVSAFTIGSTSAYFAGTAGGGVFSSVNQGQNWTMANTGLATATINVLTSGASTLYAGTAGGGVFSSTNQGQTWMANSVGLTAPYVNAFAILGGNLYAATNGGVFSASLSATPLSWTPINTPSLPNERYAIALIAIGTTLYVGIAPDGGVYRSDDSGGSWRAVNSGLEDKNIQSLTAIGTTLLAGTENSGIFRSINGGQNWVPANAGLTGMRVHALATNGSNFYAGTDNGVHRSTDQGQSWAQISAGMPNRAFVNTLLVSGPNFYAGIFGGLYFSTDQGQNWTLANPGLTHNNIFSLAAIGTNLFAGTIGGGVYLNTSLGQN